MTQEIESVKPMSLKLERRSWEIRFESFFGRSPSYADCARVSVKADSVDEAIDLAVVWLKENAVDWKYVSRQHVQEVLRRDTVTEKVVTK